MTQPNEVNEA